VFKTTIKSQLRPIRIKGPSFSAQQMALLGTEGLRSVKERVTRGIGADDSQMPALSNHWITVLRPHKMKLMPYQWWKSQHGLEPIRNLTGDGSQGGHMLDNLSVRSASATQTKIALTSTKARIKALANEQRSPWLWWSENDQKRILARAAQVFDAEVVLLQRNFRAAGFR
jgi:hypothetical protein